MSATYSKPNSSHWYRFTETGVEPCYELPKKNGNGVKAATLREAKELGLAVGISSIANMLPKPSLTNWLINQAIQSALTLPRVDGESLDAFVARVCDDMDAQSEKAKQFGTDIHAAIENELTKPFQTELVPNEYLDGFRQWAANEIVEIHGVELVVGHRGLGVAGRLDLDATLRGGSWCEGSGENTRSLVDFKTQNIKPGKDPVFYPEWPIQLAGYALCHAEHGPYPDFNLVSVIVNSAEPGPVHVRHWGSMHQFTNLFTKCLDIWIYVNRYNPGKP